MHHTGKDPSVNKPDTLLCEYATDPLGIDTPRPRFSWRTVFDGHNQRQTAYRLIVGHSRVDVQKGIGDRWDSGKVRSGETLNVEYAGAPLRSGERCYWAVKTWDRGNKPSAFSKAATFEMGLLQEDDWKGDWIGFPAGKPAEAPCYRYEYELAKAAVSGRLYVAALGYGDVYVNGVKVNDGVLDTEWTEYSKRVIYNTYDITRHLVRGRNVIGVICGSGWYGKHSLRAQMYVRHRDGSVTEGHSKHGDWIVASGPIVMNSVYDGETYDARREVENWNSPAVSIAAHLESLVWCPAGRMPPPGGRMQARYNEPIRKIRELKPVAITNPAKGVYVCDLGQNIAGWARITVKAKRGTRISLRYAESLYDNGTINQENLRSLKAEDVYITRGGGVEHYEPRFTYHGFRYIQIEGWPGKPGPNDIRGVLVRSGVDTRGTFTCGNRLLNQIHRCIRATEEANLHSVPTDCPQRDERMGWLNDMTARGEQAMYNFGMARFYTKWLDDIADTQAPDGSIADTAPFVWGRRPADPLVSCYLLLPWYLYTHYNDRRIIEKHYEGLKRWVSWQASAARNGIIEYSWLGDWSPPVAESHGGNTPMNASTPGALVSTGYFYYNARLLSKMAAVLGDETDRRRFERLAGRIRFAYNRAFFDRETCQYAKGSQGGNAFSLFLGLVPRNRVAAVVENIVRDIDAHDGHLTTGNQCSKYLLEVLADHGRIDTAYMLATQTTYPSWGYMLANGATTIWERWEHETGSAMNSHNHPMLGAVGAWFYKKLVGIEADEDGPGFRRFSIRPHIPARLSHASASVETLNGPVKAAWKKDKHSLQLTVSVPSSCVAQIHLPVNAPAECSVTSDSKTVWTDGAFRKTIPGILGGEARDGRVSLQVGSGDYVFTVEDGVGR
ncbi:MAG: Bacterial alpha-L-rhamnosidase [Chitinivibrionales bacterium]|nr:Bacterial alpha-L-rhamnosidase [Chitinivibrionales bacterium]